MKYTVDTSIFIDFEKHYSKAENKKLWTILEKNLKNGTFIIGKHVEKELKRKVKNKNNLNKNIYDWIKQIAPSSIVEYNKKTQMVLAELTAKYIQWVNPHSVRDTADTWVVAQAKGLGINVLSNERSNIQRISKIKPSDINSKSKIPEICKLEGIKHVDLIQYLASLIP